MKSLVLTLTLLLPLVLALTPQEDDLVFDDIGEEMTSASPVVIHRKEHDVPRIRIEKRNKHRVERLWGVPNSTIIVGHVFKRRITKEAFSGNVDHYKIHGKNKEPLPHWIQWVNGASTFLGVPTKKDVGQHHITVMAYGKRGDVAKDSFIVRVEPENFDEDDKTDCKDGEKRTFLTITLNPKFDLKPVTKVRAIENLAGFLGLHMSSFSMHSQSSKEGAQDSAVKPRDEKHSTSIQWQIGCNGHTWSNQARIQKEISDQVKDGTLAEVLQVPVLGWRVKTEDSRLLRDRREAGSGDWANNDDTEEYYDEDYDESYDDAEREDAEREDDEDNEAITEIPTRPYAPNASASKGIEAEPEHPHRHHHGEETIGWKPIEEIDEHDIVPMVDQRLGNGSNRSSTNPVIGSTTTPQTSTTSSSTASSLSTTTTTEQLLPSSLPPSSTATTTKPTTTTTTTTESTATEIPMSTFITQSIMPSAMPELPITIPATTTISLPSTGHASASTTHNGQSTISTTMKTTRSNAIDEIADRANFINNEYDNDSATKITTENIAASSSVAPPLTTSPQTTDPGATAIVTFTEKMETKSTSGVYANATEDEPTETTEMPTSPSASTIAATTTILYPTTTTEMPIVVTTTTTTTTTTEAPLPETPRATTTSTTEPTTTTTTTTTTEKPPTTPTTTITDKIEYGVRNFPPRRDFRLKKIPVTAGKPLSYVIPNDTFSDIEDGNTRKLRLSLYLQGNPVKATHWLQLNPQTQEVYGLPLENDVSKWDHDLVATDSEGLNVTERLDIYVQQHKLSRSVNHEFSIYLKIDKRTSFPNNVDWELKVVRSLAQLYGDSDPGQITVRSIAITQDQAIFTWTNDSVPRSSECPKDEINRLLHVLIADKDGEPSVMLMNSLAPEIRVKRVVYQGIGQCEEMKKSEAPKIPTQEPKNNFAPILRNQVDHINATVGQLLVYKVPDDTFYDPEDGSAYNMQMSLLTNDRAPIPPKNWLQFDVKNREFYGVPLREDIGRKEYQLIVTDKEGASATDGMVVIVQSPPFMRHSVEFSMTLAIPYETFAHSAMQKRTFIEKVAELFHDKDTSAISLDSINKGSTIVTWRNTTLPTGHCPNYEISRLSEILVKPDKSLTDQIEKYMGEEFPVKQITLTPMGMCLGHLTGVHSPDSYVPPSEDSTTVGTTNDDYLITFVLPAIIIAAMLVLAGIIACVLYRRRRSGKMSVSEQDDERQSFRSKGIPVIFQDELDEKPDPGNKSPVILKEEKPPLPPPEYQKAEDGADVPMLSNENSEEPYQPPPPFATNRDSNRQNRPKPTPTYRKPPPYVPP